MAERPILFSAAMVRALLDGRKTQTRRILNPQPEPEFIGAEINARELTLRPALLFGGPTHKTLRKLPRPPDRLWVRENLTFDWSTNDWLYAADRAIMVEVCGAELETPTSERWPRGVAPSIHMPRFASRLTLIVTDVRVQRLQEISEEDARAEGAAQEFRVVVMRPDGGPDYRIPNSHRGGFANLWNSINGPGAWEANPWVAAYTFTVHRANIDALARDAA